MIDLSWSHIFIVVIVALIVVGPKDLPKFMRTAGRWMGKARAMADQFRKSFDEMSRQAELDELRAEIDALRNSRPLADATESLHQPILPADMLSGPVEGAPAEPAAAMSAIPSVPVEAPIAETRISDEPSEPIPDHGHVPPAP